MIYVYETRFGDGHGNGGTNPMKPARKLLSAVSAVALALTPAVGGALVLSAATVSVAEAAVVRSIQVSGNTRVSAATIADLVGYEPGKNYTGADLDDAVKRLFATGLFSDARAVTSGSAPRARHRLLTA